MMKKQKTEMVDNNLSSWSDPPLDILCAIIVRLLSVCEYRDVVRLCAVCKSWRVIICRMYLEPIDVFCEVAYRLQYEDLVRLSSVCKFWRFIIYKVYLKLRYTLRNPGMMYYFGCDRRNQYRYLSFFDISVKKFRGIKLEVKEELRTFGQVHSKFGWIILANEGLVSELALVLYHPLTNEVIQLPNVELKTYINRVKFKLPNGELKTYINCSVKFKHATFTRPPTSPYCAIFVFCPMKAEPESCIIGTCKLGDDVWRLRKVSGRCWNNGITNMIFVNGVFCFVVERRRPYWSVELATLDVAAEEESSWVVDCTPITVAQEQSSYGEKYWLVESDRKLLLAIFRDQRDVTCSYLHVYEFNWSRKDWTRVRCLGNQVLILHRLDHYINISFSCACPSSGDDSKLSNTVIVRYGGRARYFTCSCSDGIWRIASICYV